MPALRDLWPRRLAAIPASCCHAHPQVGELGPLLRCKDAVNLVVCCVQLLTHLRTDVAHGRIDFRSMTLDDLQHLRLLLRRELQRTAEVVGHSIGGKAPGVAREKPPAVDQVEVIAGNADQDAGDERDHDDHHGRYTDVTRH